MIIYVIVFLKIENSDKLCYKLLRNTSCPLKCKFSWFDLWLYYACIEINHFSLVSPTKFSFNNESNKEDRLQHQNYSFLHISRHFHSHLYSLLQCHNLVYGCWQYRILYMWILICFLWVILKITVPCSFLFIHSFFFSHTSFHSVSAWSCERTWLGFCFELSLNLIPNYNRVTLSF